MDFIAGVVAYIAADTVRDVYYDEVLDHDPDPLHISVSHTWFLVGLLLVYVFALNPAIACLAVFLLGFAAIRTAVDILKYLKKMLKEGLPSD